MAQNIVSARKQLRTDTFDIVADFLPDCKGQGPPKCILVTSADFLLRFSVRAYPVLTPPEKKETNRAFRERIRGKSCTRKKLPEKDWGRKRKNGGRIRSGSNARKQEAADSHVCTNPPRVLFLYRDAGRAQLAPQAAEIAVIDRAGHAGDDGPVDVRGAVVDEKARRGIKGEALV